MIEDQIEIANVRANLAEWLEAFNAKDIQKLFLLYDPESIYANADAPLMRGIEQIKPWYQEAFKSIVGTLRYKEEAAVQDGNLAMLVGMYYFEPPAEHTPASNEQLTGRVSLVYRRNDIGLWRLLFDMDNTPPDVTPKQFL